MTTRTIVIVSALCWLGIAVPQAADAQYDDEYGYHHDDAYDDVDFDIGVHVDLAGFFRPGLAPYGRWSRYGSYGDVWCPTGVGHDWRPYRYGHWVLTDAGWAWVSDEPWGWGPYHYGRWFHADAGWCWVPGREWAPSWVSWRHGGGIIGWAPLPPSVGWQSSGVRDVWIQPHYYNFVEERHFVEPRMGNYYVPFQRVERDWGRMRDVTNYERRGRRINVRPFQAAEVERFVGRPVKRQRVVDVQRAVPEQLKTRAGRRDRDRDYRVDDRGRDRADRERAAERTRLERDRADSARRDRVERERAGAERRDRVERERADQERARAERARQDRFDQERAERRQRERAMQQERARQNDERARRQAEERQERAQRDQMQQQRRREAEQAREQRRQENEARERGERVQEERARQNDERARRQFQERQERAQRDQVQQQRRQAADQAREQRRQQSQQQGRERRQEVQEKRPAGSDRIDEKRAQRQQHEERRTGARD